MPAFLVACDLRHSDSNYDHLCRALQSHSHCRVHPALWFVRAEGDASALRDLLRATVGPYDPLYVVGLGEDWAATTADGCTEWLRRITPPSD